MKHSVIDNFFVKNLKYIYIYIYITPKYISYIYFITLVQITLELLCIHRKTNIYYNAMIGDLKIQKYNLMSSL